MIEAHRNNSIIRVKPAQALRIKKGFGAEVPFGAKGFWQLGQYPFCCRPCPVGVLSQLFGFGTGG